jgi:integrase
MLDLKVLHKALRAIGPTNGETKSLPVGSCGGLSAVWGKRGQASWSLVYRDAEGVQHRAKLGLVWVGPRGKELSEEWLSLEDATRRALEIKRAARAGNLPFPLPKPERAPAVTAAAPKSVLLEDAIQRYLDAKQPKSRRADERMLATNVGALMSRPLTSITRADTRRAIDAILERGSPVVANRVFERLRAVFKWCQGREMIAAIPLDPEAPSEESARTRVLTDRELVTVWRAAGSLSLPLRGVVHTLALTGARRSEVSGMRWQDLDLDAGSWTLPAPKNGVPHVVPLTAPVLEIIRGQQRLVDSPWVFTVDGMRPVSCSKLGGSLQRAVGFEENWTLHDIRRTVRTGLPRLGISPDVAERVIGHVLTGIRSVYDRHAYLNEKRDALERWADHVGKIVS